MAENKDLFTRLKKMFATDVIVRNVGGKKLKVIDTDEIQYATDRNSLRDRFNRLRSSTYNLHNRDMSMAYQASRLELFRDYDVMDMDPIIASALDIYSDECLVPNEYGQVLAITSENENIKKILENLFYDIMNIEFNMWSWTRNMCKYGDMFLRLEISPEYGVFMVHPISPYEITRIEGSDPKNVNYVKYQHDGMGGGMEYENFEIAHFRLLSDSNFLPYGKCLAGHTSIWTSRGPKTIKDIIVGDEVYSFDADTSRTVTGKVKAVVMSGIKQTYEINTAHRTIRATEEHPFLTSTGKYKALKELTIDDYLVLPSTNLVSSELPKLTVEYNKSDSRIVTVNEGLLTSKFSEFVRFFGFMLGDGWLDASNNTVAFSLGDRLDKSQKFVNFIESLGLSPKIRNEGRTDASCVIGSVYLFDLLKSLDFRTGTNNKVVPSWVWKLNDGDKIQFVLGFADADGCDRDDNTFQIAGVNKILMADLREVAMSAGLSVTRCWESTAINEWHSSPFTTHYFTVKLKSRDFKLSENGVYHVERIRSIIAANKEEVYDIQIDNNLHNFIANGVVVHNSMVEPARRVWKQLSLMEDAMLIHRIMRAPEKRMFYIDVGNIPPSDIDAAMQKIIGQVKKVPYIDERTGDYNLRFNLNNMIEDFYLPVRGSDSGTRIDTLPGMEFTGIDDLEYIRNKMMAALKIPKAFLGYEEGLSGKATLAAEDVRFARTIGRVQRIIVSELTKIAIIHLYVQGYQDASLVDFELELCNPSTIFEQEKIEIWTNKVAVANDMMEAKLFSKRWIYNHVFNLSDADIEDIQQEVVKDQKELWRMTQISEEGNDPATSGQKMGEGGPEDMSGGGGGGMGGGGDVGGDLPDLSGGDSMDGPDSGGEGLPELEETKEKNGPVLDEETRKERERGGNFRPSQDGKKAEYTGGFDKTRGEDPLGAMQNKEKPRDKGLKPTSRGSTLSLKEDLKTLKQSLRTKYNNKQKQMITEKKSMLDESNLLQEDKHL